jgi:hypothetical protein
MMDRSGPGLDSFHDTLQHQDSAAEARQVCRGDQSIVAGANDVDVVVGQSSMIFVDGGRCVCRFGITNAQTPPISEAH